MRLMKRIFDIFLSFALLIALTMPMCIIAILVRLTSPGPALYWSNRIGQNNVTFKMPKFRTMLINTPEVATHLLSQPDLHLTSIGGFLRRNSFDEFPQLLSIIKGDMSFVGPRPALFNQNDLINLRNKNGIDKLLPGLTGWAQVNGRDDLSIPEKVTLELFYMNRKSFLFDLKILCITIFKVLKTKGISH